MPWSGHFKNFKVPALADILVLGEHQSVARGPRRRRSSAGSLGRRRSVESLKQRRAAGSLEETLQIVNRGAAQRFSAPIIFNPNRSFKRYQLPRRNEEGALPHRSNGGDLPQQRSNGGSFPRRNNGVVFPQQRSNGEAFPRRSNGGVLHWPTKGRIHKLQP